tara:strand:- start:4604 stop:4855 length:252 start_codon:yes stop_codon:yes gene_type:complete
MGELINLQEWKAKKDEEERKQLADDIDRMHADLKEMIGDMEEHGEAMWPTLFLDTLPQLVKIDKALSGYVTGAMNLDLSLDTE